MACRIIRNDNGTVKRVLASNNEPSILYQSIRNTMSEEEALLEYAGTFTDEFQQTIDYLKEIDTVSNIYDVNDEINYQVYDYIMHPEKYFGKNSVVNPEFENEIKKLPIEIFNSIEIVSTVPDEILGSDGISFAMKDVLYANGITDPLLINWLGINKSRIGHPKYITSTKQIEELIEKVYNRKLDENKYLEFKFNPLALESFREWKAALADYPLVFQDIMLTHAIKYLNNPNRRAKYVLQLSKVALTNTYGILMNKPNEANRLGKLYDQEVLASVSDAIGHEPSASGNGYWVHVPRTSSGNTLGYDSYERFKDSTELVIEQNNDYLEILKQKQKPDYYNNLVNELEELKSKEKIFFKQEINLSRTDANKYGFQEYDYVRTESTYSRWNKDNKPHVNELGQNYEGYYIHGYNTENGRPSTKIVPITKKQAEELWEKEVEDYPYSAYDADAKNRIYQLESQIESYNQDYIEKQIKETEEKLNKLENDLKTYKPEDWDKEKSAFKKNVELLRKLSPHTWCTASSMTEHYVENYDNYLLIVNGVTVAGIEAYPDTQQEDEEIDALFYDTEELERRKIQQTNGKIKVKEVTSRANNGTASIDHLDDTIAFFEKHNLDLNNQTIQRAINARDNGISDDVIEDRQNNNIYYDEPDGPYNPYGEGYDMDGYPNDPPDYFELGPEYADADEINNYYQERDIVVGLVTLQQVNENLNLALKHFDVLLPEFKNNEDLARQAVENHSHNIKHINIDAPYYNELARIAVEKSPYVFEYLSDEGKNIEGLREIWNTYNEGLIDELPFSKTNNNLIQGYYDANNDKVVVVESNTPIEEAAKVAIHEVAHRGMLRMAKELGGVNELASALFAAEKQLMQKLPELLQRTGHKNLDSLLLDYGFNKNTRDGKIKLLMELTARWAETLVDKSQPSWWKQLIKNITNWIKQFTGKTLNEQEVNDLVGGFVRYGTKNSNSSAQFNETQHDIDENIAPQLLDQISERLSRNLGGVPYNLITEVDAISLLSETQEKYNGQPAFFYNGQVYFIKDKLNLENVFHEFSHPFIKAIKKTNPTLFNKLFDTLSQTQEGQEIIRTVKEYYKYDENSEDFKEEVLVRALTTRARNNELNAQESTEFTKFIDKLMYAIKQLMRKVFGKIKIDKLNANTNLDQLAKMLNNDSFEISSEIITESEKADFNTMQDSVKDLMAKASDTLLQSNIDKLFKLIGSGKQIMKEAEKRHAGLKESISKEKLEAPFQEESSTLSKYQTYTKTNEAPLDLVNYRKSQIEALVLSLQSYNDSIEKIILEINRSRSDVDSVLTISKNMYFLKNLSQTLETFDEIKQQMVDEGISVSSPVFELLNKASNNAKIGMTAVYAQNEAAIPGILAPHLKGINEVLNKEFDKSIAEMVARGATTEQIAAKERERDSYIRDENTLARVISGKTPEPSGLGLSILVESAVSSPDELISSFALYVKEALIDVELNATKNFNDFLAETRKLLKDAGLDDFKLVSKLGKIITYTEELGYKDPKTGEFKTHKVHRFLNPFKGYEVVLSKFKYDIDAALESGDTELASTLEVERQEWKRTYMHDKWKPEVYKIYDVFKKTYVNDAGVTVEIGKMARERYDKIMEDINNGVKLIDNELERIEIDNRIKIDTLWVEYKKLFSEYDNDGNLKTGDEMGITQTLLEYRTERKKYFEWESDEDPESMPIYRFKKARSLFEAQLLTKYPDRFDPEYVKKLQEWDDMNTRKVIDKQFYVDKALIIEKINAIYNSLSGSFAEDSKIVEKTKEYWNLIIDQLYAYRDEENHPNGILVSKEKIAKIKEAQEKIQELQDMIKNGNGLSRGEAREYRELKDLSESGRDLTQKQLEDLEQFEIRSSISTIPKGVKQDLKMLYDELSSLQSKKATDYYLEVYNHQIDLHNNRQTAKGLPITVKHFDRFDIDDLARERGFVESMIKKDPEFEEWFMANHNEVERWDDELQMRVKRFERLFLWNQIEPRDPKYVKSMNWKETDKHVHIWGLPSLAYYKQNIKPEFATEEILGVTVDNKEQYLPRLDVPNSPYINQAYFDLKDNNEGAFNILEKIKEFHLKFQEKAPASDKLYMDVPRYEKTSKELTETNKFLSSQGSAAKIAIKNFVNKFRPNAEDTDEGLGIEDKFKLTKLDFFDEDEQKIHISGKTLMDDDQVSLDVITSVLRHMHSIERASKLSEIEPIAKGLMQLLNDPKNQPKDTTKASWYHWITHKIPVFANKRGENIRAKAIKGLIDRTFYNVQQTGFGSDALVLQKLSKVMMQAASFGFFALDIPSGVKNRFGQQLQQAIELAAGTSYDGKSFLKGKMIASKAMMQISGSIYSKGKLPYYAQLVNAFDPSQGMAMEKLPEYITRSIYKDVASPTNILMSPRKFMEIEATLEYFFGVMEFTKVEQTINGVTTEIPYHEAFELVDDRLTLKEGIDEKWGLGGSEFKRKRIFIQEKQNILNGVYSKFDQPEGNRYLFYRMFMFLRKFFITGMVNRFGFSGSLFAPRFRRNNASQTLEMGYWIQSARALSKMLVTYGKHWHYMRPSEKGAVYKALTEIALLTILSALIPMLFGWDGDDDDKYEKLRERQGGPLGSKDFKAFGWLANHLLYQTMSVASENSQYYKVGFYSDMLSNFNLANGPSLQTYGKILGDVIMMVQGDDSAYYSKDVGPYSWQKAESAKILNHIGKAFALTGKTIDPSKAIQDFVSAENIYK